jgi:ABC-type transport system substrate-binding protein
MKPHSLLAALTISLIAFIASAPADATADAPAPAANSTASPSFSLTIYSNADPATFDPQDYVRQQTLNAYYAQQNPLPGYGIVRENRPIDLQKGENEVRFIDVASGIDPTTVSFESLDPKNPATVMEQNYEYDLVSADKLLGKYVGKEIQVVRHGAGAASSETISGTLLSFDGSALVLQDADGKVKVLTRV